MEFAPFGPYGTPPPAGKATRCLISCNCCKVACTPGIEAFNRLFNLLTLNETKAVMVCTDSFKLQTMTAFNEKFLLGGPGGTVFSKRVPPGGFFYFYAI